jgi:hypothetical protein
MFGPRPAGAWGRRPTRESNGEPQAHGEIGDVEPRQPDPGDPGTRAPETETDEIAPLGFRARRRARVDARRLARDCEAVVTGRFADLLFDRGDRVPVWAWSNLLAHGTESELRREVKRRRSVDPWRRVRGTLAARLLEGVDAGRIALAEFQRETLVPLELELMSRTTETGWTVSKLEALVSAVLPPASPPDGEH